jgi:RimJ/RimL family protein N-acetyltransferase
MATDQHVGWLNDPEIVRYSEQRHKTHTLESQHRYLNDFPADSHIWLISLKDRFTFNLGSVGTITAYVDSRNKLADMGILIGERIVRGFAYGLEAWVEVMRFLFSDGTRKIECGCMSRNAAMRMLAAKSDMTFEGLRRDHFMLDGRLDDLMLFGKYA